MWLYSKLFVFFFSGKGKIRSSQLSLVRMALFERLVGAVLLI